MEIMNKITKTLIAAVFTTLMSAFMLMGFIYSATIGDRSNMTWFLKFAALLAITAAAISWWVRYLRAYVDHAIKRELERIDARVPD